MPHLDVKYSTNLETRIDTDALCRHLADHMRNEPMFPIGGIRVRLLPVAQYQIADGHPENGFLDATLRIGAGRTPEAKQEAGQRLFDTLTAFLHEQFQSPHLAVSLEIQEIDPQLSWKKNSIHPRLKAT